MWEWITGVAYYAHGYCLSWDPWLIGVHAASDLLIFGSYTAIPLAILVFVHRRPGLEMKGLARFFAAFIFWCGLSHLTSLATLWFPIYDVQAAVKLITAAISVPTAVLIFLLIPKALTIPSPKDLYQVNASLLEEIKAHEVTLRELRETQAHLEEKVHDRTRSLEEAAEQARTLAREVAHRSGNLMSVIAAMARQSAKAAEDPRSYASALADRISALARSQNLLFQSMWRDIDLTALITAQIEPVFGSRKVQLEGPPIKVHPEIAHHLGMAFHELATNSVKHGAMSVTDGVVMVRWRLSGTEPQMLHMEWREYGGPLVEVPAREGWGTAVTRHIAITPLQGNVSITYKPDGLRWNLEAPLVGGVLGRRMEQSFPPDVLGAAHTN